MKYILSAMLMLLLTACASMFPQGGAKFAGSAVEYLYPDAKEPVKLTEEEVAHLRVPVRVGIAFAPTSSQYQSGPTEDERLKMLQQVKDAFSQYKFIGAIEVIPSAYLQPGGGFANLEQAARMFNVDVVALLSYDQVQFNDSNNLSLLYWTIIGAYVIHGDQYDVHTMLDASVFDVRSHKLLFRAPGASNVKGGATMVNFSERSRAARTEGFNTALTALIPNLRDELMRFRERVKTDNSIQIENRPGYSGGGSFEWLGILIAAALWVAAIKPGSKQEDLRRHALLALACLATMLVPESWSSALEYQREAVLEGEWWRLWSGHFVHFGMSHAAINCTVLFLCGCWLAKRYSWRLLTTLFLAGPVVISLALLYFAPEMSAYRGASGLAALLLSMCLADAFLRMRGAATLPLAALTIAWAIKLYFEIVSGSGLSHLPADIHVAWQAHIAGIAAGLFVIYFQTRLWISDSKEQTLPIPPEITEANAVPAAFHHPAACHK